MALNCDSQLHEMISKTKELDIVGDGTSRYEFKVGNICDLVYKQSVIDIEEMDAIVNATSSKLGYGSGISGHILKAAGQKMANECQQYIKRNGALKYSEVCVTSPGQMPCKGIIHAVGPVWSLFPKKDECAEVLCRTIRNCLDVMVQRGWVRMALCAVSSGVNGVPTRLCTAMYMRAIENFASDNPQSKIEIHFIDVDQNKLDSMIEAHKERVKTGKTLDFDDALKFQQ